MKKLLNIKYDGTINFSIDRKLYDSFQKISIIFTNKFFGIFMIIFSAVIDINGFKQIADETITQSEITKFIIIAALAISFDLAPVYMGYAICLRSYNLGGSINSKILWLSSVACILGIIANTIFRVLTINEVYFDDITKTLNEIAFPITILMCILPIITSLINLVIGCLSFDPLLFDISRLSKKLHVLKINKRKIDSCIDDVIDEKFIENYLNDIDKHYEKAIEDLDIIRLRLKLYIKVRAQISK